MTTKDKLLLDLPFYDDGYSMNDIEDNSFTENPLAREFAIKTRKCIPSAEAYNTIERHSFYIKHPKVTKAEKRRERGVGGKRKVCYSVFEDMVILTAFSDKNNKELSMNEVIDLIMTDLTNRTFESLRERYRKWLKDFNEEDVDKIIRYCDECYEKCESYMIKRKFNQKKRIYYIDDFIEMPKYSQKQIHQYLDTQVDSNHNQSTNQQPIHYTMKDTDNNNLKSSSRSKMISYDVDSSMKNNNHIRYQTQGHTIGSSV